MVQSALAHRSQVDHGHDDAMNAADVAKTSQEAEAGGVAKPGDQLYRKRLIEQQGPQGPDTLLC